MTQNVGMADVIKATLIGIPINIAVGGLCGHLFQIVPPLGGAIYCVTYGLADSTHRALLGHQKVKNYFEQHPTTLKTAIYASAQLLALITPVAAACKVVQLTTGLNMTLVTALKFSITSMLLAGGITLAGSGALIGLIIIKDKFFPTAAQNAPV